MLPLGRFMRDTRRDVEECVLKASGFHWWIGAICAVFAVMAGWYASFPASLDMITTDDYSWYASLMQMYDATTGRVPLVMLLPNAFYASRRFRPAVWV